MKTDHEIKMIFAFCVIFSVFFINGCYKFMQSHTRLYSGAALQKEEVSFIFPNIGHGLFSVDGKRLNYAAVTYYMEVLPGPHTVYFDPPRGTKFLSALPDEMAEVTRKEFIKALQSQRYGERFGRSYYVPDSEYIKHKRSALTNLVLEKHSTEFIAEPGHMYVVKGGAEIKENKNYFRIYIEDVTNIAKNKDSLKQLYKIYNIKEDRDYGHDFEEGQRGDGKGGR